MTPTDTPLPAEAGLRSAYETWRAYVDIDPRVDNVCWEAWQHGAKAALASAPVVGGEGDREAVARIIDPVAWATRDIEIAHPTKNHKNKVPFVWADYYQRACEPSFAKADAILALSAPIPVDGWMGFTGGDARRGGLGFRIFARNADSSLPVRRLVGR